jgi:hypothetical protein
MLVQLAQPARYACKYSTGAANNVLWACSLLYARYCSYTFASRAYAAAAAAVWHLLQAKKLVDNSGAPTIEGLKMQVGGPRCQSWFCCTLMAPAADEATAQQQRHFSVGVPVTPACMVHFQPLLA